MPFLDLCTFFFKSHANCAVEDFVAIVLVAIGNHHDHRGHTKNTRNKVSRGLIGDECMNTAAKLSTSSDQNSKYHGIGTAPDDGQYQTNYCNR